MLFKHKTTQKCLHIQKWKLLHFRKCIEGESVENPSCFHANLSRSGIWLKPFLDFSRLHPNACCRNTWSIEKQLSNFFSLWFPYPSLCTLTVGEAPSFWNILLLQIWKVKFQLGGFVEQGVYLSSPLQVTKVNVGDEEDRLGLQVR